MNTRFWHHEETIPVEQERDLARPLVDHERLWTFVTVVRWTYRPAKTLRLHNGKRRRFTLQDRKHVAKGERWNHPTQQGPASIPRRRCRAGGCPPTRVGPAPA